MQEEKYVHNMKVDHDGKKGGRHLSKMYLTNKLMIDQKKVFRLILIIDYEYFPDL